MNLKEFNIQNALGSLTNAEKRKMAANPSTPIEILVELSIGHNRHIRRRVAMNTNIAALPEKDLIKLANDTSYDVRYQVSINPHTPAEILIKMTSNTLNKALIKYNVQLNPNTPEEVAFKLKCNHLKKLIKKERKTKILYKINKGKTNGKCARK